MCGVLLPLQVGYPRETPETDTRLSQVEQDGYISATVTFLLLISVGLTMSIGYWMTEGKVSPISNHLIGVFIMVIMTLCCILILGYLCRGKSFVHPKEQDNSCHVKESATKYVIRSKLVIIGLTVFYLFGMFIDGFRIVAKIYCVKLHKPYAEDIFFHAIHWTFMTLILIFVMVFDKRTFIRRVFTNYSLIMLGTGVVVIWFDSVLYEYTTLLKSMSSHCNNITVSDSIQSVVNNSTSNSTKCRTRCTDMFILSDNAAHFLYTFTAEFALLALKLLAEMFFGMKFLPKPHNHNVSADSMRSASDSASGSKENTLHEGSETQSTHSSSVDLWSSSDENEESTPLLQSETDAADSYVATLCRNNTWCRNIPCMLTPCFLLNLVFIIFSVTSYQDHIIAYFVVEIIYWTPMILCSVVGFYSSRGLISNFSPYSALEIMVMLCSMGIFCYDIFSFYSVAYILKWPQDKKSKYYPSQDLIYITLAEKILNITEAYFQAIFLLYARRVKHDPNRFPNKNVQYRVFRECLFYLSIANLFMWGNDSFVKVKNPAVERVMNYYYGRNTWTLIIHLTFPFALFYRFNSFLLLLHTLLTH